MRDLGSIVAALPGSHTHLDHFRVLYGAWIAGTVLLQLRGYARFVARHPHEREVPRFLGWVPLPRLPAGGFIAVGCGLVAMLVAAVSGWAPPAWPLLAAAFGAVLYFAQVIDLPDVRRKANTVPIILLLVGAVYLMPAAAAEEAADLCRWTIQLVVAQMYLSSGLMKLRAAGLRWADGVTLRTWLVDYHLSHGSSAALALARRPWATRLAAGFALGFELTFWLVIPFPALVWVYLPLGVGFHLGTSVLMRIRYWRYIVPAYLAFVQW